MLGVEGEGAAAPLARMARVSLVEVSPSMEMELKECADADLRRDWRGKGAMGASVHRMPRRVAMLGWIMPAPFVIPAREYVVPEWWEEGRVNVVERSLGKVSVVIIARAVLSQELCVEPSVEWAVGMPLRIFWSGRR